MIVPKQINKRMPPIEYKMSLLIVMILMFNSKTKSNLVPSSTCISYSKIKRNRKNKICYSKAKGKDSLSSAKKKELRSQKLHKKKIRSN